MGAIEEEFFAAKAHESAGRISSALAIYDAVLAADPEHPIALWRIAEHDLAEGRVPAAIERLERALRSAERRGIPTRELWFSMGRACMARPSPAAAKVAFGRMLDAAPDDPVALLGLGSAALACGDPAHAAIVLRRAVAVHPGLAGAWASLAVALSGQQRLDEAYECAQRAVRIAPDSVAACQVFAVVAIQSGRAAAAVPVCRAALARAPGHPVLVAALADALKGSGDRAEARTLLEPLMAAAQPAACVIVSYGALCVEMGEFAQALPTLERAVAADPGDPRAWDNLGTALKRTGNIAGAANAYARAVELNPKLTPALCNLIHALRTLCDWERLDQVEDRYRVGLQLEDRDVRWNPFVALSDESSSRQQLQIARTWSQNTLPQVDPASPTIVRGRGARLRIGYLSSDFQEHATARLMAGLFERHDRSRVEVFAYSAGRDDRSEMRSRLRRAFDHWVDVTHDDAAAARRIREDGVDVLVDLKGHTQDNRLGILCARPAPVQIHYLGFPGTLGFDAISHIVADVDTVPAGDDENYHEVVVRMPRCYQVNDDRRRLPPATSRSELGLPEKASVLACFNQTYKLSRRFLRLWAEAMRDVPESVLWLFAPDESARANILRESEAAGLSGSRIVFAPATDHDSHLARLRSADLALDVLPYGSHTTGSDALWCGVPMLTCLGETFAGRVGASLLRAVDLPELVTQTTGAYSESLRRLLREPERLRQYRDHLETQRGRLQLFDCEGFTRDFERMLEGLAVRP